MLTEKFAALYRKMGLFLRLVCKKKLFLDEQLTRFVNPRHLNAFEQTLSRFVWIILKIG